MAERVGADRRSELFLEYHVQKAKSDVGDDVDLYLRAKVREAEEMRRKEEHAKEEMALRRKLAELPADQVAQACDGGWDGMQEAIEVALGDGAWARAVNSVPDDWEEEEALEAISDLLRRPLESTHVYLLLERD